MVPVCPGVTGRRATNGDDASDPEDKTQTQLNCWALWCQTVTPVTMGKQNTCILKQPVWVPENQSKCQISEKVYCNSLRIQK